MQTFISYSHRDTDALDRLRVHLTTLKRDGYITEWFDREILAGDPIDDEIMKKLEESELFLLLVSPDFIASDYCIGREMKRALERHEADNARVVPIIVEPCDWKAMDDLRRLKALPKDGLPISKWLNPNDAYLDIVEELRRIIDLENPETSENAIHEAAPFAAGGNVPRYRVRRDFDEFDRGEFRDAAFLVIKTYFQQEVHRISSVNGLRGRFVDRSITSFGVTVVNSGLRHRPAHITIHRRSSGFPLGDIYYSFVENSPDNSAEGGFNVSSDEYEQFLVATWSFIGGDPGRFNPDQAAEYLWKKLIKRAGLHMPESVRFRCNNCGYQFEAEVLDNDEREKAREEGQPIGPLHCPKCHRTDIRRGWE